MEADRKVWTGFPKWAQFHNYSSKESLRIFEAWQADYGSPVAIGLCLEIIDAVDVDTNDLRKAQWMRAVAHLVRSGSHELGPTGSERTMDRDTGLEL